MGEKKGDCICTNTIKINNISNHVFDLSNKIMLYKLIENEKKNSALNLKVSL